MKWIPLQNSHQIEEIITNSFTIPAVIFKHSTRCIVSKMALKNFENNFNLENKIQPYFLDLLEYRTISNEVATRFNIQHQSPQIIVIKNGVAVYVTSHEDIDVLFLERFV